MLEDLPVSSQLEIWSWCIGRAAELGRYITSPFRADSHPGCVLKNWNGAVILMDSSGRTGHGFTCLHAVAHFKGFYKITGLNLYLAKSLVLYNLTFGTKPVLCPEPVLTGFKKSEETIDTLIKFYPKGGSESPGASADIGSSKKKPSLQCQLKSSFFKLLATSKSIAVSRISNCLTKVNYPIWIFFPKFT